MVSGARISRADRKAQTRDELVQAADRIFCDRGFHGASLDLVAAGAGYTKGAVYSNFASKEDLFFAVYERRVQRGVAEMERAVAAHPGDWRTAIARQTLARRDERDAGWPAVFFEFWAHVLRHPPLRERFAALHAEARRPLTDATRAMPNVRVDADRWTAAIFAMVTGLALEQLTDPHTGAAELASQMIDTLIRGIGGGDLDGATG